MRPYAPPPLYHMSEKSALNAAGVRALGLCEPCYATCVDERDSMLFAAAVLVSSC
jgi:hypothetical protein